MMKNAAFPCCSIDPALDRFASVDRAESVMKSAPVPNGYEACCPHTRQAQGSSGNDNGAAKNGDRLNVFEPSGDDNRCVKRYAVLPAK